MNRTDIESTGWIIVAERVKGRAVKRHYLVAVSNEAEAIEAAQKSLGTEFRIQIGGPAAAIHFKRRNIKSGEVFSLSAKNGRQPS